MFAIALFIASFLSTQAARLECLEPRATALLSMLEGVPARLKLLLTRYVATGRTDGVCPCCVLLSFPLLMDFDDVKFSLKMLFLTVQFQTMSKKRARQDKERTGTNQG